MDTKREMENIKKSGIAYSCYHATSREGEHFVPEHTLSFQIAGSLVLNDGVKDYASSAGMLRVIKRNQLLKFVKQPPADDDFKSLSIYFSQKVLKNFSRQYDLQAIPIQMEEPVVTVNITPILQAYIRSLIDYIACDGLDKTSIVELKLQEGLLLLLEANPSLQNVLFDFTEPHKIDLESFMERNYHFNVHLDRFAYLTGRSLATFKRDFQRLFKTSPRHWLQQKRLQQAHHLLAKEGETANNIYLELGFENLSHFSYAFKKEFGYPPSKIPSTGA